MLENPEKATSAHEAENVPMKVKMKEL